MQIGALVPLTRPGWVEVGQHLLAGMELAAREVDLDLELVVRDTAADPQRAAAAVDELVGLGVAALAGEYHSVAARGAAARADALGVPFVCSSAVLDALTDQPTDWVARLAPPQSWGWRRYAEFLIGAGHTRVAVAAATSVYWAAGTRILHEHLDVVEIDPADVCEALVRSRATAVLVLLGVPATESVVRAVRRDPRLADVLIGAPAGQPELADWATGIPFLRYRPERLNALGTRVESELTTRLGESPSFVALEGYDAILVLAERLRGATWSTVAVEGTRGEIRFSRVPGISVWQWAEAPIHVFNAR
ncbi:ABC transporter substrate-binding protein [Solirubrobacter phytolaccae]|uniref:ABC transporter substrate-binding protein n=1 Tax=Solirubrobacter phytolaccae TaxID=1404360 RepID=A0A9X3NH92_9ACTN|nr:ABC transporter substrate-binding protein [Solirubrobacter phytolaccae]MDA0185349.1 ABC transporter substrate-binding protein [Solirubrobacter phytolaccae]